MFVVDVNWDNLEDQPRYFQISFISITNSSKKEYRKIDFTQKKTLDSDDKMTFKRRTIFLSQNKTKL